MPGTGTKGTGASSSRAADPSVSWPVPDGDDVIFVTEVATDVERKIIDAWISEHRPGGTRHDQVHVEHFRRPRGDADLAVYKDRVAALLDRAGDPWLAPLRVAWLPPGHSSGDGTATPGGSDSQSVRLRDVVTIGDPRRPRRSAQRVLARRPERYVVVNGGAAKESWLRRRWRHQTGSGNEGPSFPHFLLLQGILSMERAEAARLGAQYKVPRMVREDLASGVRFQSGLSDLAHDLGRPVEEVSAEAHRYLEEMVTGYGRVLIDLMARFGRFVYSQGYDADLDYDDAQVARVRQALRDHPAVVLPTHKSMLDAMVMPAAFRELGFPRSHTVGGVNLAFWPMGPLMRRAGVIFIRRKIADNPVYRYTLREYIGYLVEKRFNLEWYIEGGRTRTGKLLPPRLGLLAYVAEAYWQGRAEDVVLLPIAIAYDQLHEVGDYTNEARGGIKRVENLAWLYKYIRAQRDSFGRISVRFGEPVSMRKFLGPPPPITGGAGRPDQLALQKMAFEVAVRINRVTPITASALVAFTLLGAGGRALTRSQVATALEDPLAFVERRQLPLAESARRLSSWGGLGAALDELRRHHVLTVYEEGSEPVFIIQPDNHLEAAFYRNSILHFFLQSAIGELAVVRAAAADDEPLAVFWYEAARLRDLLKFDFFFPGKVEFNEELAAEMSRHDPSWETQVGAGGHVARGLLGSFVPLCSPTALRSFLEAYMVVADVIAERSADAADGPADEEAVLRRCLALGRQYVLQREVQAPEAVSKLLFTTGLQLAANRGLLEGRPGVGDDRRAFGAELRTVLRAVDVIGAMAEASFTKRVGAVTPPAVFDAYAADLTAAKPGAPAQL
ncbi:MAG TPA: glycerol-3-phosphate 1-O-acyltransferase [Acidimicrobiales bacterium]|nr:glycerol-3-phosphate 1-O-acyltransferase [Acidimicrobiales bacterium]